MKSHKLTLDSQEIEITDVGAGQAQITFAGSGSFASLMLATDLMAFARMCQRAATELIDKAAITRKIEPSIVIVESPFAGPTDEVIQRNIDYARSALADCLGRFEAPYASHLLYTQPGVLRDGVPAEREKGMKAGFAFIPLASKTVVYTDLGLSSGMKAGIARAEKLGIPVEYRSLRPSQVVEKP